VTTPRLRDALAVARINRIKARSARMQKARIVCDCPACSGIGRPLAELFRALGVEPEPAEAAPTTEAKH
jgi:hypothetical protein